MTSLIIVNFNTPEQTIFLANSCLAYKSIDQIVIVDNKSTDNSLSLFSTAFGNIEKVHILPLNVNSGYARGNNAGCRFAMSLGHNTMYILANPDVLFSEKLVWRADQILSSNPKILEIAFEATDLEGRSAENQVFDLKRTPIQSMVESCRYFPSKKSKNTLREVPKGLSFHFSVFSPLGFFSGPNFESQYFFDEGTFLYCEEGILGFRAKRDGFLLAFDNSLSYVHDHQRLKKKQGSSWKSASAKLISNKYMWFKYGNLSPIQKGFLFIIFCFGYIKISVLSFLSFMYHRFLDHEKKK